MLSLHEEILGQIKNLVEGYELQSNIGVGSQKQIKRSRWRSIETLEGMLGEKATNAVRRSLEIARLKQLKHPTSMADPKETAEIAKLFERMVYLAR